MRYIGFRRDGAVQVGALAEDGTVTPAGKVNEFWEDPFAAARRTADGPALPLAGLELVPPVRPSARVLCVGLNYPAHVDEGPFDPPEYPTVFARWHASLAVSDTPVAVPPDEAGLDWEGELVAAVGRPLSLASEEEALGAVFAYAAFNDITARRAQKLTTQWTIGKNADNSGPLSPFVTADEVGDPGSGLRIVTTVNGEVVQDGKTSDMVFGVGNLLSFLSRAFELRPGDLVATGTPNGVGYARTPPWLLNDGDLVQVDIEKVGSVRTPVVAGPAAAGAR
ncbi:MAG TPA: fumarylacetoacetate hydrolase family protein [Trebonia sp.]|jgi:2-keto-4-pentenoate hydratase/2-oxohepta-3-ene-1,7-dioic acid hydratase in catechol pathway